MIENIHIVIAVEVNKNAIVVVTILITLHIFLDEISRIRNSNRGVVFNNNATPNNVKAVSLNSLILFLQL